MNGKMQKAGGWHDSDEMDYGLWIIYLDFPV